MTSLSSSLPFLFARHLVETANNETIGISSTNHTKPTCTDCSGATTSSFNPTVFWSVNCFILFMLLVACLSCRYGGKLLMRQSVSRTNSDQAFMRNQLAREARAAAAAKESPAKRKKRVQDSFRRCQVTMVVKQEDILDGLDDSEARADSSSSHGNTNGTAAEAEKSETDENVIVVETGTHTSGMDNANDAAALDTAAVNVTDNNVETAAFDVEEDGCNAGYLVLRGGKTESPQQLQQPRKVPNCCAICLSPYDVGELVVWSSNVACKHAFHEECMVDWLCKIQASTPCPCCRQEFTDIETYRKAKKITWLAGDTFNLQTVQL